METSDILNVLIKTDPFDMLDQQVLIDLCKKVEIKKYPANKYIFKQGDPSLDGLFVIASGLVEITVTNEQGIESVVGLRRSYDFFSETVVLSQQRYPGSARVKEDVVCIIIPRKNLENLIYRYPDFSGFFNALLAERMRLLYEKILAEQTHEAYSGVESFLFRKRVSEVMTSPVLTCRITDQISEASKILVENDISSIVALDSSSAPRGILTEKNLVKYLIAFRKFPIDDCRVEKLMNSNLVQMSPESFLGQALVTMTKRKTKQLVVMERGKLVGIVTMTDLIKTRSTGKLVLSHDIDSQNTLSGLSSISREIDDILNTLIAERAEVCEILDVMSELHESLSRRIIQLSEEKMKLKGWGTPPVDYCWINMGSAARNEQTLRTDQDNAIIYADPDKTNAESINLYFKTLAEFIVQGLSECGFARCTGNVMATNPKWRKSLGQWMSAVADWTKSYDPEDTRTLTILLDYRPVWGNRSLAEKLRDKIFSAFKDSINVSHGLTKDDFKYIIPINFMGKIITEKRGSHKNQINLKTAGIVHIVNGARILAVNSGISEPSTFGRLDQLTQAGLINEEDTEFFRTSFETLMMFKIRENMKKVKQGKPPDNYIDPSEFRKSEIRLLKDALSGVSQLQKLVNKKFNVMWLKYFGQ